MAGKHGSFAINPIKRLRTATERKVLTAKLSARDLTLIRGERCIFQQLEFALNPGELLLLQGQNGSGKTSLLRTIAGMLSLESGEIRWNDVPVLAQRQEFHSAMVWLAHRSGLKGDLTPAENLRFEAALRPQSKTDIAAIYERLGISRLKRLPLRLAVGRPATPRRAGTNADGRRAAVADGRTVYKPRQ